MQIIPQNYHNENPAQRIIQQRRVDYINGTVTNQTDFGSVAPTCEYNLALTAPNQQSYIGEMLALLGKNLLGKWSTLAPFEHSLLAVS